MFITIILSHQEKIQYASIINWMKYLDVNKSVFQASYRYEVLQNGKMDNTLFLKTTQMQLFFNISMFFPFFVVLFG